MPAAPPPPPPPPVEAEKPPIPPTPEQSRENAQTLEAARILARYLETEVLGKVEHVAKVGNVRALRAIYTTHPSTAKEQEQVATFLRGLFEGQKVSEALASADGLLWRQFSIWCANDKEIDDIYREAFRAKDDIRRLRLDEAADGRAIDGTLEPVYWMGNICGYKRRYSDSVLIHQLKTVPAVRGPDGADDAGASGKAGAGGARKIAEPPPRISTLEEFDKYVHVVEARDDEKRGEQSKPAARKAK